MMKNKKGFTLVELMIVICVIGILSFIAAPSMSRYLINSKTKGTAQDIYGMLQQAKLEAIKNGVSVCIEFGDGETSDPDFSTVSIQSVTVADNSGNPTVTIISDLSRMIIDNRLFARRTVADNGRVVFNSRGIINGGYSDLCGSWVVGNASTNLRYLIQVNIIGNITMRPTTT